MITRKAHSWTRIPSTRSPQYLHIAQGVVDDKPTDTYEVYMSGADGSVDYARQSPVAGGSLDFCQRTVEAIVEKNLGDACPN